jgi:hypothetical protein
MNWVILHRGVPDLFEEIDPLVDLAEEIRKYDGLSTLSCISTFFLDTFLPCVFSKRKKL